MVDSTFMNNVQYGLVTTCEATNNWRFHSSANRKTAGVTAGVKRFAGKNFDKVKELFTDNAKEFIRAGKDLGLPNPRSMPRRP